jgi:cell division septation protein DedD
LNTHRLIQRIVGVIVFTALVLTVISLWRRSDHSELQSNPQITDTPVALSSQSLEKTPLKNSPTNITTTEKPLDSKQREPMAPSVWVIQLGLFKDDDHTAAVNLTQKMLESGFKAFNQEISVKEKVLRGVFVGPFKTQTEAIAVRKQLLKKKLTTARRSKSLITHLDTCP